MARLNDEGPWEFAKSSTIGLTNKTNKNNKNQKHTQKDNNVKNGGKPAKKCNVNNNHYNNSHKKRINK